MHDSALDLTSPLVVGILNVTPDSYFDGGKYLSVEAIGKRALTMKNEGADIIEIGGESTGPGSKDVSLDEERERVLPAIVAVKHAVPDAWISIDTWKADLAREAIITGAHMINDVTAGRRDPRMFDVIASLGCPVILMHAKDNSPRTTANQKEYEDVIASVRSFLIKRISEAEKAGIKRENIIIDPGLGHFVSADPKYSFEILDRLRELTNLAPILVSPSRKSFLAGPMNLPPKDRLPATLEATKAALKNGAMFIRTHDVGATRRVMSEEL